MLPFFSKKKNDFAWKEREKDIRWSKSRHCFCVDLHHFTPRHKSINRCNFQSKNIQALSDWHISKAEPSWHHYRPKANLSWCNILIRLTMLVTKCIKLLFNTLYQLFTTLTLAPHSNHRMHIFGCCCLVLAKMKI